MAIFGGRKTQKEAMPKNLSPTAPQSRSKFCAPAPDLFSTGRATDTTPSNGKEVRLAVSRLATVPSAAPSFITFDIPRDTLYNPNTAVNLAVGPSIPVQADIHRHRAVFLRPSFCTEPIGFGGPCGALARVRRSLFRFASPHGLPPSPSNEAAENKNRNRGLVMISSPLKTLGVTCHRPRVTYRVSLDQVLCRVTCHALPVTENAGGV